MSQPSVIIGVTALEVLAILNSLSEQSADGSDGNPYRVFKSPCDSLLQWFVDASNAILESGIWPETWKLADIVPVPKGSGGFGPISLLMHLSKILERVIHSRLKSFVIHTIYYSVSVPNLEEDVRKPSQNCSIMSKISFL